MMDKINTRALKWQSTQHSSSGQLNNVCRGKSLYHTHALFSRFKTNDLSLQRLNFDVVKLEEALVPSWTPLKTLKLQKPPLACCAKLK